MMRAQPRHCVAGEGVQMDGFAGRTVLITGASEGIGRALALALAAPGVRLALNARNAARLTDAGDECAARGAEVLTLAADVSRQSQCAQLVAGTVARFGALDVLVNNAGITMWSRFDAIGDLGVFERLLAVNYLSAVYTTAAALPHLKAARGLIVAVASVAGLTGVPERTAYAASKHAMVGFFESLRIELAGSGVDVTIVAPDFVRSALHRRALGPDGTPLGASPMQESRIMTAEECARLIVAAMRRRQRLLITSARGRLGRWARLVAPSLVDRIAARAIRERH
jgi:short-subunit dehydrogenase